MESIGVDHAGLGILDRETCARLLASTPIGRLAFISDGDVVVMPVNFRYHEGTIVIRTAVGSKLEAAARHAQMTFEIDQWDDTQAAGWSVIAKGRAREVLDDAEVEELSALGLRPWADADNKHRWIRIRPDELSGRKIE